MVDAADQLAEPNTIRRRPKIRTYNHIARANAIADGEINVGGEQLEPIIMNWSAFNWFGHS